MEQMPERQSVERHQDKHHRRKCMEDHHRTTVQTLHRQVQYA